MHSCKGIVDSVGAGPSAATDSNEKFKAELLEKFCLGLKSNDTRSGAKLERYIFELKISIPLVIILVILSITGSWCIVVG